MDNRMNFRLVMAAAAAFVLSCTISCSQGPEGPWKLDRAATMIDKGDSFTLKIKGKAPGKLVWSSDDEAVAEVGRGGKVRALSYGDAWIYALCPETGTKDSCLVSVGYQGQNPLLPPSWDLYIADGEPHVFDGRMYIYGSRDCYDGIDQNGGWDWCSDNYHVIWSDDLVHWTDAGEALNLKDIPESVKGDSKRLWAPDVFRDPVTGKYHMAACTNADKIFILDADSPEGPFTNARTLTLDGKELGHIDPGVLVDDDGKVYVAIPKFIVAQLDPEDYSRIIPESVRDLTPSMPTDNEPFEGPSLRKRDGIYYYIYIQNTGKVAENGAVPTRMAYLTAPGPLGPYTYRGLIVSNHEYPNAGNIHGSIEPFKGQWYVQYHKSMPGVSLTRVPNLDKVEFNEDGTIREVNMTTSGVRGAFRPGDLIQASGAVEYSTGRKGGMMVPKKGEYPAISFTEDGQWTCYRYIDLSESPGSVTVSVRSELPGGKLELHLTAPDGPLVATLDVPDTQGMSKDCTLPVRVDDAGKETVYLVAARVPFSVNSFIFKP
ncbi:MAG: family 43 glycosylhydrolase [Bacteroidales bacterium]|nr:family 43 glycosylhydrolase [Bacteroidales bacterium]